MKSLVTIGKAAVGPDGRVSVRMPGTRAAKAKFTGPEGGLIEKYEMRDGKMEPVYARDDVVTTGGKRDPRDPDVGTVITREFKGVEHRVTFMGEAGWRWETGEGGVFKSPSQIAKKITGSPANGYVFFGLGKKAAPAAASTHAADIPVVPAPEPPPPPATIPEPDVPGVPDVPGADDEHEPPAAPVVAPAPVPPPEPPPEPADPFTEHATKYGMSRADWMVTVNHVASGSETERKEYLRGVHRYLLAVGTAVSSLTKEFDTDTARASGFLAKVATEWGRRRDVAKDAGLDPDAAYDLAAVFKVTDWDAKVERIRTDKTTRMSLLAEMAGAREKVESAIASGDVKVFTYEALRLDKRYRMLKVAETRGLVEPPPPAPAPAYTPPPAPTYTPPPAPTPPPAAAWAHPKDPRLPAPGSSIFKVWKSAKTGETKSLRVFVEADKFVFDGKEYDIRSLSKIAEDAGAGHVNGYIFFGLGKKPKDGATLTSPTPPEPSVASPTIAPDGSRVLPPRSEKIATDIIKHVRDKNAETYRAKVAVIESRYPGMKPFLDEMKTITTKWMHDHPVVMRVPIKDVPSDRLRDRGHGGYPGHDGLTVAECLEADGRMKSLHEVKTGHGCTHVSTRKGWEKDHFNGPIDRCTDDTWPCYGSTDLSKSASTHYGDAVFVLKEYVKHRTTITTTDSSSDTDKAIAWFDVPGLIAATKSAGVGYDVDRYGSPSAVLDRIAAMSPEAQRREARNKLDKYERGHSYMEAQIHGGVHLEDVAEVHLPRHYEYASSPTAKKAKDAVLRMAAKHGIKVVYSDDL